MLILMDYKYLKKLKDEPKYATIPKYSSRHSRIA